MSENVDSTNPSELIEGARFHRSGGHRSKYNVEAAAEKSMVRRNELTEAWVSGIDAHVARIEVIGCVEYSQRQSHAILLR